MKLQLFLTFFKIGLFTFGGGYAMIPLIEKEIVHNKKWIKEEDILEIVAIAESTPGPIAVNAATFVGYRLAGFFGALAATCGVVLPSFVIILAISGILQAFRDNKYVQYAFLGIRAGVLALVIKALISLFKKAPKGLAAYLIMAAVFILAVFTGIDIVFIIIGSAVVGLVYRLCETRKQVGKG